MGVLLLGLSNRIVANVANHSVFIKADGSLLAMGSNEYGQLGEVPGVPNYEPYPGPIANVSNVVQITAGFNYTLFLKSDGIRLESAVTSLSQRTTWTP